ncbi:MAG: ATP-dependent zinc protease [Euryarchaeota archaeon]|nr:ATP-dependent zinc protease [Euryarchaeota archaeon]
MYSKIQSLNTSLVSINHRIEKGSVAAGDRSDTVSKRTVLGWREWIGLPELENEPTLAKMDTGAWSNTLHAEEITLTNNGMEQIVRFRLSKNGNWIERPLFDWRRVRDTGGHDTLRPVIRTTLEIAGQDHDIQLCLQDRSRMKHRIILGRRFLRQFIIDPSIDCLHPKERTTPRVSEY